MDPEIFGGNAVFPRLLLWQRQVVLAAVAQNAAAALPWASPKLRRDPQVVLQAVKQPGTQTELTLPSHWAVGQKLVPVLGLVHGSQKLKPAGFWWFTFDF